MPPSITRFALLCVLFLLCALPAATGPTDKNVPGKTADFLIYCRDVANRGSCKAQILRVDIQQLAYESCSYLGEGDKYEQLKMILDWLAQHPETKDLPTDDGVRSAMKALWPCKL